MKFRSEQLKTKKNYSFSRTNLLKRSSSELTPNTMQNYSLMSSFIVPYSSICVWPSAILTNQGRKKRRRGCKQNGGERERKAGEIGEERETHTKKTNKQTNPGKEEDNDDDWLARKTLFRENSRREDRVTEGKRKKSMNEGDTRSFKQKKEIYNNIFVILISFTLIKFINATEISNLKICGANF